LNISRINWQIMSSCSLPQISLGPDIPRSCLTVWNYEHGFCHETNTTYYDCVWYIYCRRQDNFLEIINWEIRNLVMKHLLSWTKCGLSFCPFKAWHIVYHSGEIVWWWTERWVSLSFKKSACQSRLIACNEVPRTVVPNLCWLDTPWQPISINGTLYISKVFVINIVAVDVCAFSAIIQFFFRVPLNVLVRTPGVTRTPGWESLA
jgi:hypothetical protein